MGTLYYSPADQTETRAYRGPCGVAYRLARGSDLEIF